ILTALAEAHAKSRVLPMTPARTRLLIRFLFIFLIFAFRVGAYLANIKHQSEAVQPHQARANNLRSEARLTRPSPRRLRVVPPSGTLPTVPSSKLTLSNRLPILSKAPASWKTKLTVVGAARVKGIL